MVVQIITGIPGTGILGRAFRYYTFVFTPAVVQSLNGIAWWAVMMFVWIAGVELDLRQAWKHRRSFSSPVLPWRPPVGAVVGAAGGRCWCRGWMGPIAHVAIHCRRPGMSRGHRIAHPGSRWKRWKSCARRLGQRILRYASLDDIAIWGVLALVLMDWARIGKQARSWWPLRSPWCFIGLMTCVAARDRWFVSLRMARLPWRWGRLGRPALHGGCVPAGAVTEKWFEQAHGPVAPPQSCWSR